jgi:anti-sigma regulatory factor (Ser/Thr protein kinase)
VPVHQLDLPSVPESAGTARRFARRHLRSAGAADEMTEDVVLLTSEVVTNAVLHSAGPVRVRLVVEERFARVEVDDGGGEAPIRRNYAEDAPTGRGLTLVADTATAWGTEPNATGKTVWFEVGAARPPTAQLPRDSRPDVETAADPTAVRVKVLRLPVSVYLETQAQNDALLREFALIAVGHGDQGVPRRLLELVDEVRSRFAGESAVSRRHIQAALERGDEVVDFELEVPPAVAPFARQLAALLDEADDFCAAGDLLTLAASPTVRRFRDWYLAQVVNQLNGDPPEPWA